MQKANETAAVLQAAREQYRQGRFRAVWDALVAHAGEPARWQDPSVMVLGARALNHLGRSRTAEYLILRAQRLRPQHYEQRYYYAAYRLNNDGPWATLGHLRAIGEQLDGADRDLASSWLALYSSIFASYRDWERAQDYLDQAKTIWPESPWLCTQQASLLERQDRYQEALELLAAVAQPELSQLRSYFELLILMDRRDDAKAVMAQGLQRFQSVDLWLRHYDLLLEDGERDEALAALEQARALIPELPSGSVDSMVSYRDYEICYERGEVDEAITRLAGQKNHFLKTVRENLLAAPADAPAKQLAVGFVRQHHMTCAPATFAALARYFGHPFEHLEIAEAICYDGTPATTERRWISELGWTVREFELTPEVLCQLIDRDIPVALGTVDPGNAHLQAIVGYDLRKGVYFIRDPFSPLISEMLIQGTHERYAATGPRCMVMLPPERAADLADLELPAEQLYDHYYALQMALSAHDRDAAQHHLQALCAAGPDHRLALWGQRSLANYDDDYGSALAAVEALRARYPDDLNLMVSQAHLLEELGREEEQRTFLRTQIDGGHRHPVLLQTGVDALRFDHRHETQTRAWLEEVLRKDPTRASALYALAGLLWDQGEHAAAYELYWLCTTLEDKSEHFAQSYFKAARYMRDTERALAWLRRRHDTLGRQAAGPSITLAQMLDLLERTPEANTIYEQALTRHPDDVGLLREVLDNLLTRGALDDARALLDQLPAGVPASLVPEYRFQLAKLEGDPEAALHWAQQLSDVAPLHLGALHYLAEGIRHQQDLEAAIALIEARWQQAPYDSGLRGLLLDFYTDLPPSQCLPLLEAFRAAAPFDSRITQSLSGTALMLGDTDTADALALEMLAETPDHAGALMMRGRIARRRGEPAAAAEHFRELIRLRPDHAQAFQALLECYTDVEDKRAALTYIHSQLVEQVTFGDGIQAFVPLARRYLDDEQVREWVAEMLAERPDLWQCWLAVGQFHNAIGEGEQAEGLFRQACERFPLLPRLWLELGRQRMQNGDLDGAREALNECTRQSPQWVQGITTMVDILEQLGEVEEAEQRVDRGLARYPDSAVLLAYKADLLWRRGEREDAYQALRAALSGDPDYGWAWNRLQHWARALDCYEQVRELAVQLATRDETNAGLWSRASDLCEDKQERERYIDRALALVPHSPHYVIDRCHLLWEMERLDEAWPLMGEEYWQGAVPIEVRTFEAWLRHQLGEVEQATALLRDEVVQRDPSYATAWRHLAHWYRDAGDSEACLDACRRWVAIQNDSANVLTDASELMLEVTEGEAREAINDEVSAYLERAMAFDYSNAYLQMTLLDHYLDSGAPERADALMERLLVDEHNLFLRARQLRLALAMGRIEQAWPLYRSLICDWQENEWLLFAPEQWYRAADAAEVLDAELRAWLRSDEPLPATFGGAWAYRSEESDDRQQRVDSELDELWARSPEAGHRALWRILVSDLFESDYRLTVLDHQWQRVVADERLPGVAMEQLVYAHDDERAAKLVAAVAGRTDLSEQFFYFANFSVRVQQSRWDEGVALIAQAADVLAAREQEPTPRMELWLALDHWLAHGTPGALHALVELPEFHCSELEQHILAHARVLAPIYEQPLHRNGGHYLAALKQLNNSEWDGAAPNRFFADCRKQILATVPGGWRRLWWQWRLRKVL
ncbi:tetratricopeptide repeat protein [Isoalcanivorax beigongshangi]|uniref:Tetratricopeptide repeat protein n=1 Tax=Isoalcanivorax beigongshangi TaxID=3238810 RepID=A0ABV4AJ16_9GAMM